MKKLFTSLCIIFLLFTGCMEQPANLEQTAVPTASPTPVPTEFVPAPLEPAELTEEQWEQMKKTKICMTTDGAVDLSTHQSAAYDIRKNDYSTPNSFRYVDYYGTYQDYIAVYIIDTAIWWGYWLWDEIYLWKDNVFYHLQDALNLGLITEEDAKSIIYYDNNSDHLLNH